MFDGFKFGVLKYSYGKTASFQIELQNNGFYTVNLGDYIQSIAVISALKEIGVQDWQIVLIDRDCMSSYQGDTVYLIMNAVFYPDHFPLPENIKPIYFGFSYHPSNILPWNTPSEYWATLSQLNPSGAFGCRDQATADVIAQATSYTTYVSGCLSQSFQADDPTPDRRNKPILICGLDNEELGRTLAREADSVIYLKDQRMRVSEFPLSQSAMKSCHSRALELLDLYKNHISMTLTSLMHCAGPCASLGIPTTIIRHDPENIRFSTLKDLLTVMSSKEPMHLSELRKLAQTLDIRDAFLVGLKNAIEDSLH